jgi:hypothetical protein
LNLVSNFIGNNLMKLGGSKIEKNLL